MIFHFHCLIIPKDVCWILNWLVHFFVASLVVSINQCLNGYKFFLNKILLRIKKPQKLSRAQWRSITAIKDRTGQKTTQALTEMSKKICLQSTLNWPGSLYTRAVALQKMVDPGLYIKVDSVYAIFGRFVLVIKWWVVL